MREYMITWKSAEGFRLDLFDTGTLHNGGPQQRLAYVFLQDGDVIFRAADFGCSPVNAIDGPECVAALLGFLSLRPDDTDVEDYFDGYTEAQLAWRDEYAETLGMYASDDEETIAEVRDGMYYDESEPKYAPIGVDA